jgi:hypothetical protein
MRDFGRQVHGGEGKGEGDFPAAAPRPITGLIKTFAETALRQAGTGSNSLRNVLASSAPSPRPSPPKLCGKRPAERDVLAAQLRWRGGKMRNETKTGAISIFISPPNPGLIKMSSCTGYRAAGVMTIA